MENILSLPLISCFLRSLHSVFHRLKFWRLSPSPAILIVRLNDRLPVSISRFLNPAHRWTSCSCSDCRDGRYIRRSASNSLNWSRPSGLMVPIMANNTPRPRRSLPLHTRESCHARRSACRICLHQPPRPLGLRSLRTTPGPTSSHARSPALPHLICRKLIATFEGNFRRRNRRCSPFSIFASIYLQSFSRNRNPLSIL